MSDNETVADYIPALPLQLGNPRGASKSTRRPPPYLRGRDRDLLPILETLHNLPESLQGIIGPPGTGKTSMLEYIQNYAAAIGMDTVTLNADNFDDDQNIVEYILPGSTKQVTESTSGRAGINMPVIQAGGEIGSSETRQEQPSISEAVRMRAALNPDLRLLVTIDEFQAIDRMSERARTRMRKLLNTLHTNSAPRINGHPIRTAIIIAGHLNSYDVADRMEIYRTEPYSAVRLHSVDKAAARQICMDHITALAPPPKTMPTGEQLDELYDATGGFPQFITYAVQMLIRRYRRTPDAAPNEVIAAAIKHTEQQRTENYRSRINAMEPAEADATVVLAHLIRQWPHAMLPSPAATDVIRMIAERHSLPDKALTSLLRRRGAIEQRPMGNHWGHLDECETMPDHWTSAVHSFTSHVSVNYPLDKDEQLRPVVERYSPEGDEGRKHSSLQPPTMLAEAALSDVRSDLPKFVTVCSDRSLLSRLQNELIRP